MSPEKWKTIPGFPEYEASTWGKIRMKQTGKILPEHLDSKGWYRTVNITNGKRYKRAVHRLVLETFKGVRPEGSVARHLDDNQSNNRIENLEWGTPSDNQSDRRRNSAKVWYKR